MKAAAKHTCRIISLFLSFAAVCCCMLTVRPVNSAGEQNISLREYADRIAYLVNSARAEAGVEPLLVVPYLNECAEIRSQECAEVFSHTRPNGDRGIYIVDDEVILHSAVAENIACGNSTPDATFAQWKNSSPHWAAILNPDYNYIGVGVYYNPDSEYNWYWTQLFIKADGAVENAYSPSEYTIVPKCSGDLTGDGRVDCFDYIIMKREFVNRFRGLNALQQESADVMADGTLNISDLVIMRGYILGKFKHVPMTLSDLINNR